MKKVMVFFLLLLVACMGFAAEKSLQVTLKIKNIPVEVAFTDQPYTDPQKELKQMDDIDYGEEGITAIPDNETLTKSFWASAKTNSANHLTMEIYGTALTRDKGNSTYETIPLELSIATDSGTPNSSSQTMESPVTLDNAYTSSMSWSGADWGLTLVEGASGSASATSDDNGNGVAGTGTRALTWKLSITPTLAANQPQPTAGSYVGCLWLVVES